MMDTRKLLEDSAERIFADLVDKPLLDAAETGEFPDALSAVVVENGFDQAAMAGSGVELGEALGLLKVAGRHAVPLPLAEMMLGSRWLNGSAGLVSVGLAHGEQIVAVPWGRKADVVLGVSADGVIAARDFEVDQGTNLAGEPRDIIRGGKREPLEVTDDPEALLALSRALLMAGGLEAVLGMTLTYVGEREQFGRPISKFQAIQHHMAVMAAEVAAAIRSAEAGLAGLGGERQIEEIAQAKIRVGESVGIVAELAQQVHGAMGYTHEHRLHHSTRRLWAWRDEFGSEVEWQIRLGRHIARLASTDGADAVWDFVASRG